MSRRPPRTVARLAALALAAACYDAGEACVTPPCVLPLAIEVTVTAPAGAPTATVAVSGAASPASVIPCQVAAGTVCHVLGGAGTYELDVAAPGFRPEHRTVTVTGTPPGACGCGAVDTQRLTVALTPAA